MSSLLLYIHGFNSSPLSVKAQQMKAWCETNRPDIKLEVPRLACYPADAAAQLEQLVEQYKGDYCIGLVGSSLGGYLSTWLNDKYGFRAALVNPAVKPYALLADYLGPQQNPYTGEQYLLQPHHMDELKALETASITHPDSMWLLQQEGDEVLDYRQAVSKYQGCKQTVEAGGDHAFVGFDRYPAEIIQFLGL
ncbi:esterase YqiA [Enterovibrio norvegicus FF-162]|uniref:esterase YqiA n=1 Tax=Enterovibrio norvegicus TaxID=188144 RepID=UPI0002F430CB|nr:esterase YqiA [Enterovibrio norvegicus]OEE88775.1 esterase YqiA [Enterovibrio norvegicus FF-162]